jgi:predicted transcriptional regulator
MSQIKSLTMISPLSLQLSPVTQENEGYAMTFVNNVLKRTGRDVWTVSSDSTVYDALQKMADESVGALMVVDGGNLVGVLSEPDYGRKIILHGKASNDTSSRKS